MWKRQMIRLATGVAVVSTVAGLGVASANAAAAKAPSWSKQATEPQAQSGNGPALTVFDGRLYAAWTGLITNKLFYADYSS